MPSLLDRSLLALGCFCAAVSAVKVLQLTWVYIRPSSIPRYRHGGCMKRSAWGLVTGATDGIGHALVRDLARRGFNVVLHGRNPQKLQTACKKLELEFPNRNFRFVVADAAINGSNSEQDIQNIVDQLNDIHLTILINSVGPHPPEMHPYWKTFDDMTPQDIDGFIYPNARFATQLTSALLPQMLRCQPSLIVNIGSMADSGSPWHSVYSGSKAFLMAWSKALSREMRAEGRDVEVIGVLTGRVTGTPSRADAESLFTPDASTYARAVLDRVGCGYKVVCGYWAHAILKAFGDFLPDFVYSDLLVQAMRLEMRSDGKKN